MTYRDLSAIRTALETGMIEGVPFRRLEGEIEPGDTYLAQRNTGVHILTCKTNNKDQGWIVPVEPAYPYDTHECVRVELLI